MSSIPDSEQIRNLARPEAEKQRDREKILGRSCVRHR